MTNRQRLHHHAIGKVSEMLAAKGLALTGAPHGELRIHHSARKATPVADRTARLHVATVTTTPHHITSPAGTRYTYRIPRLSWSLHLHGRPRPPTDVVFLVARVPHRRWQVFVVPGHLLNGKLSVSCIAYRLAGKSHQRHPHRPCHWLAAWKDRWKVVTDPLVLD